MQVIVKSFTYRLGHHKCVLTKVLDSKWPFGLSLQCDEDGGAGDFNVSPNKLRRTASFIRIEPNVHRSDIFHIYGFRPRKYELVPLKAHFLTRRRQVLDMQREEVCQDPFSSTELVKRRPASSQFGPSSRIHGSG